jgi:hypothetical protein
MGLSHFTAFPLLITVEFICGVHEGWRVSCPKLCTKYIFVNSGIAGLGGYGSSLFHEQSSSWKVDKSSAGQETLITGSQQPPY